MTSENLTWLAKLEIVTNVELLLLDIWMAWGWHIELYADVPPF